MPFKKYLSILIKIIIVFFSFYFIYSELVHHNDVSSTSIDSLLNTITNNYSLILIVVLMMFINWILESLKWKFMIRKIEEISFFTSFRAIFSGITVSSFTPNRIGEYGGRVFCLEKSDRIQAVFITILCSMAQLLTTIIFGSFAFIILHEQFLDDQYFIIEISNFSLLVLSGLNILFVLAYFNVTYLIKVLLKFSFFNFLIQYINVISLFNTRDLLVTFLYSVFRYLVFSIQFLILLYAFNVDISFYDAVLSIMLVFFFITLTPTITIAEIGVRGSMALLVFMKFSSNVIGILSSTFLLWIINLIIPAIIGSFFIFSLKFFRKS
tara:strand:- start:897 stop:1868 length:972 start_codon:yes stop_codon:yes gene_type:complete